MANLRNTPFIHISWLKNYLIGDDLCKWSIWHRIHHYYDKKEPNYDSVSWSMKHTNLLNKTQKFYESKGYEVIPEFKVKVHGKIAQLSGSIDLIAIKDNSCLVIEVKTGTPRTADKVQLMLYIWALPKSHPRFYGTSLDGLIVYESFEKEISALDVDDIFVDNFSQFMRGVMSGEPDRKFPSVRECDWCVIKNCDERMEMEEIKEKTFISDLF